jgi:Transposase DDE domain
VSTPAPLPDTALVGDIEQFLQAALTDLAPDPHEAARPGPGRPRVLPSLCLWAGLLVCVLRGFTSYQALWRLLSQRQLWFYPRFPVSDQAVYNRLAQDGTAPLEQVFAHLTTVLQARLAPYAQTSLAAFATAVVALDETTLDPIARLLPALRTAARGAAILLPGKLSGVFDVRLQQWRTVRYQAAPYQNEKVAASTLVAALAPGTLVLADLGYFGFAWFDALTTQGLYWLSRLRAKTSYRVLHTYYDQDGIFDGLVWLGAHRADRAAHAVRLVRFTLGATTYSYVTNVLDPCVFPLAEIAAVYARRWDIELAFKLIKQHLGLHLLWAAQTTLVLQQVWAVLIISQVLQALRLEIAGRAGVEPDEVSMALLVEYAPQFAYEGHDPVALIVATGRQYGFIRPSRRLRRTAPTIPLDHLAPLPPDLALTRPPRYAQRKGAARQEYAPPN